MERKKISAPKGAANAQERLLQKMYISNVAKRLRELNQPSDNDRKRWLWELIQNAKDTIVNNPNRDFINIGIVIDGNTVQFIHDGDPFTLDARFGLLWKYSEDKQNQESTGRFGTGFLTTHCLSKVVEIQSDVYGDYEQPNGFKVTMYRDGQTEQELLEGLEKMKASEEYYEKPYGKTTYTYHVNTESGRKAIQLGLKSFYDNIAQTMLFCKELNSVELNDNGEKTSIKRLPEIELDNGIFLASFETIGKESNTRHFIYKSFSEHNNELSKKYKKERNIRIDAAIEVNDSNNIVSHSDKTSFFCSLPLVGIESQLEEPLIINSPDFEPDSERQSLILKGDDFNEEGQVITETGINHLIYERVMPLYEDLVAYLTKYHYGRLYFLANGLKSIKDHPNLDKNWYKENVIAKYRSILLTYPVATSHINNENHVKLTDCIFIKEDKGENEQIILNLLENLYPEQLVRDNHQWSDRLWKEGLEIWNTKELCKDIETKKNWNNIILSEGADTKAWYNDFLKHVNAYDETLLKEYALLPNLNGDLLKRDAEDFKQGENLSIFVIELLKQMGKDVRPFILDASITTVSLGSKYNSTAYSAELNRLAKNIIDDYNNDKLSRLKPLLCVVVDDKDKYEETFCKVRRDYFDILNSLYYNDSESYTTDNNILKSAWEALDNWFENQVLSKIESLGELAKLPQGLDITWLNKSLEALRVNADAFNGHKVIPNQKGVFCKQEILYKDGGIPEELKVSSLEKINVDFKSILLDSRMDARAYAISKEKTTSDVASQILRQMGKVQYATFYVIDSNWYSYPREVLNEVSCYLITLLPNNQDPNLLAKQDGLLNIAKFIMKDHEFAIPTSIDYSNDDLWKCSNLFLSLMIMDKIESFESLEKLNRETGCVEEISLIDKLNSFYTYIQTEQLKDNDRKIYPNQNGLFRSMSELKKEEGNIGDDLKNIIGLLASESEEYRNVLMNKRVSYQPQTSLNIDDAYKLIDDTVYKTYADPSKWTDEKFKVAVQKLIEEWGGEHDGTFSENFPKVYPIKDTIVLNVVWTREKRQQAIDVTSKLGGDILNTILENPDKMQTIAELLKDKNFEEIIRLGRQRLEEMRTEREETNYKLTLGKYIEKVLRSKLEEQLHDNPINNQTIYVLGEQDWEGCDLMVMLNNHAVYSIEVKSRWGCDQSILMTSHQMFTAREDVERYALCCVDMSNKVIEDINRSPESDPELVRDIIDKTKVLTNIGKLVEHIKTGDDTSVHIKPDFKCVVPLGVINSNSCSFNDMVEDILKIIKSDKGLF